jgi:hypothetical protein
MAAGSLLSSLGAGPELDERAWHAAYGYYGHDLYGTTYASHVLARAEEWQRNGFCPNCEVDERLVEEFDRAYGEAARMQLGVDDSAKDKKKKRKKMRKRMKRRAEERRAREKRARDRARRRARPETRRTPRLRRAPSPPRARRERKKPSAPAPAPAAPPPAPPPTAAPPERECPPISKLLGCKP